jgi:sirohydrochlorin cobaltochelatase
VKPALLIAGHGSRDPAASREFLTLVGLVRRALDGVDVEGGFIELARPSLPAAAASLAGRGATDVVVVPLMLLAAGHTKNDIPASIAAARLAHPGVRFRYGRDLGIEASLLALTAARIGEVVPDGEQDRTAVLVVGRGSSDPDANGDLCKVARLLFEGRPFPVVEPAFSGIARPSVAEGLARCLALGARRIVAVPYFLFTGILVRRIAVDCAAFARAHPGLDVSVAGHLGPEEPVARLVAERYREVLEGSPRMNCDLCIHRVALPGYEHRIGAPATPHHHPDGPHPDGPHPDGPHPDGPHPDGRPGHHHVVIR